MVYIKTNPSKTQKSGTGKVPIAIAINLLLTLAAALTLAIGIDRFGSEAVIDQLVWSLIDFIPFYLIFVVLGVLYIKLQATKQ